MNTTILMGARIGSNCVVGAGSVVTGNFPDNVVIAGNPAKIVCTIEEFYIKRKDSEIEAAFNFASSWKRKYC